VRTKYLSIIQVNFLRLRIDRTIARDARGQYIPDESNQHISKSRDLRLNCQRT